jgi:hypothetical protein
MKFSLSLVLLSLTAFAAAAPAFLAPAPAPPGGGGVTPPTPAPGPVGSDPASGVSNDLQKTAGSIEGTAGEFGSLNGSGSLAGHLGDTGTKTGTKSRRQLEAVCSALSGGVPVKDIPLPPGLSIGEVSAVCTTDGTTPPADGTAAPGGKGGKGKGGKGKGGKGKGGA